MSYERTLNIETMWGGNTRKRRRLNDDWRKRSDAEKAAVAASTAQQKRSIVSRALAECWSKTNLPRLTAFIVWATWDPEKKTTQSRKLLTSQPSQSLIQSVRRERYNKKLQVTSLWLSFCCAACIWLTRIIRTPKKIIAGDWLRDSVEPSQHHQTERAKSRESLQSASIPLFTLTSSTWWWWWRCGVEENWNLFRNNDSLKRNTSTIARAPSAGLQYWEEVESRQPSQA